MNFQPDVRVVSVEIGPSTLAASLNREIDPDRSLLQASLDIRWDAPDPASSLALVERRLLDLSPSFLSHQCRGPIGYHVFVRGRAGAPEDPAADTPAGPDGPGQPFDACLALAHLIEHAIIDFESSVTGEPRISGVTGARRRPPGRFDVMVECEDLRLGRLCLGLAVATVTSATDGRPPDAFERDVLDVVRLAHRVPGRSWTADAVARALGWPAPRSARALMSLRDFGYLAESSYAVNISGVPHYRLAAC